MEPRPHERGKQFRFACLHRFFSASMEPRPHERGKPALRHPLFGRSQLQWSHVLTNVERSPNQLSMSPIRAASMEPRPHERGKIIKEVIEKEKQKLQWSHVLTNVERTP